MFWYFLYYFNPRSREGSDASSLFLFGIITYFNPRSREGSDGIQRRSGSGYRNFNPRSREGSDLIPDAVHKKQCISIHAPAKGATILWDENLPFRKFQSTLPRRERPLRSDAAQQIIDFNPRSREGSDRKYAQFFIMILAYLHNIITYFLIKTI